MAKTPRWRRGGDPAPDPVPGADETDVAPEDNGETWRETTTLTAAAPDLPAPEDFATESETREPAFALRDLTPLLLIRTAHPRQAVLTAVAMALAAMLAGRPGRELVLILVTVLVGQVILGWFNDLVDRRRDARHETSGKPVSDGRLDPGTLWFCLALAVLLVVPLSVGNGLYAGPAYLASLVIGLLGQWTWLRRGLLSWAPWAASYALYPAFLSYGGWGGAERGAPPEIAMTVLAALLGVGVHLLTALWGLVPDNEDGWSYLPLRLGTRLGASRLLWLSLAYIGLVIVALAWTGTQVGLAQEPL